MDKQIDLRELRAKERAEKKARIALNRLNESDDQEAERRTEVAVDVAEVIRQANADLAVRAGEEAIANVKNTLQRALDEIDRYATRYAESGDPAYRSEVLSWTINFLATGIINNCRLDLLASAQAKLAVSAAERAK